MNILGGIAIIIGIISFFFFDIPSYFKEWRYSIYLTPKVISVDKSDWAIKKSVQIVNNNLYPIYTIKLEISEMTSDSNIDYIKIKPEPHLVSTNFSSSTDMNAFVVSGLSSSGRKCKSSIIYKIDSRSKIDIQLTIPPSLIFEKFRLKITSFSKEANNIFENQNITAISF